MFIVDLLLKPFECQCMRAQIKTAKKETPSILITF